MYHVMVTLVDGTCEPSIAEGYEKLETDKTLRREYNFDGPSPHCRRVAFFSVREDTGHKKDVRQGEKFHYEHTTTDESSLRKMVHNHVLRSVVRDCLPRTSHIDDNILVNIAKYHTLDESLKYFFKDDKSGMADEVLLQDLVRTYIMESYPATPRMINAYAIKSKHLLDDVIRPVNRETCSPLFSIEDHGGNNFSLTSYYPAPLEHKFTLAHPVELETATGLRCFVTMFKNHMALISV
jgi:hypothetical protein